MKHTKNTGGVFQLSDADLDIVAGGVDPAKGVETASSVNGLALPLGPQANFEGGEGQGINTAIVIGNAPLGTTEGS